MINSVVKAILVQKVPSKFMFISEIVDIGAQLFLFTIYLQVVLVQAYFHSVQEQWR